MVRLSLKKLSPGWLKLTPIIRELRGDDKGPEKKPGPAPLSGLEVIEKIKEDTDTVFLGFSRGKDSIAAWLKLREAGLKVVPFFMWAIPGLEFVEESLQYFEDYFETRIYRLPHPSFYRKINGLVYQPPNRIPVIRAARLPLPEYDDIADYLSEDLGFDSRPWTATGVRAADSPLRRSAISQYGAINYKRHNFYPVWDMKKGELIELLLKYRVKLPIDYKLFGRSFDGIDYRFIAPIKEHLPEDYGRILQWFPLVDLDIARRHFSSRNPREEIESA